MERRFVGVVLPVLARPLYICTKQPVISSLFSCFAALTHDRISPPARLGLAVLFGKLLALFRALLLGLLLALFWAGCGGSIDVMTIIGHITTRPTPAVTVDARIATPDTTPRILPLASLGPNGTAPCRLYAPPDWSSYGSQISPVVLSFPHAGRIYPAEFVTMTGAPIEALRGLEDFATDLLGDGLETAGIIRVEQHVARAYIDVNRPDDALDSTMFTAMPQTAIAAPSRLVRAGYGLIPRLRADRVPIHQRLLAVDEALIRLAAAYRPYHQLLVQATDAAYAARGACLLIDIHSMPPTAPDGRPLADIVLGDLHGHTLAKPIGAALADRITVAGFSLGWNHPYAGGHITRQYGRAHSPRQSVQIEVNRHLYMSADLTIKPKGLARLRHLIADIASEMGEQILA